MPFAIANAVPKHTPLQKYYHTPYPPAENFGLGKIEFARSLSIMNRLRRPGQMDIKNPPFGGFHVLELTHFKISRLMWATIAAHLAGWMLAGLPWLNLTRNMARSFLMISFYHRITACQQNSEKKINPPLGGGQTGIHTRCPIRLGSNPTGSRGTTCHRLADIIGGFPQL